MMHDVFPRDGVLRDATAESHRRNTSLPTPTVQCHAANLMPLSNGDLGCVWSAGRRKAWPTS